MNELHNAERVSALRSLAAGVYDWLLVIAIMMIASLLFVAPTGQVVDPGNLLYQLLLLTIVISFFVGFWSYRGQTPGMRAWRLTLSDAHGGPVSKGKALRRLGAATIALLPLGLGFWWQYIDANGLSWHDRWSDTRLSYTRPEKK